MRTITVEVDRRDIDQGKRGKCFLCPIATALLRADGRKWSVNFHSATCGIHEVFLPNVATDFISLFDDGRRISLSPFSFQLKVPDEV